MSESTDAFEIYQSKTGGTLDSATGLLSITPTQYANLQPLTFNIGGNSYDLPPNGQIWPRSLNTAIDGNSTAIYLVVVDIGSPSGSGLDFINGYAFLYVCLYFISPRAAKSYIRHLSASATIAYLIPPTDKSVLPALPIPNRCLTKSHLSRTIQTDALVSLHALYHGS